MAGRLISRLALLRHSRFRLLFVATFTSGIGNWLAVVALQVDVYDRTQSGWWVGALLVVNVLPAVFLGLLLGPVVDRFSRNSERRICVASSNRSSRSLTEPSSSPYAACSFSCQPAPIPRSNRP